MVIIGAQCVVVVTVQAIECDRTVGQTSRMVVVVVLLLLLMLLMMMMDHCVGE